MRRLIPLLCLLAGACAAAPGMLPTTLTTPGGEGLPAMLMTRTVVVPGPAGNRWELAAGTTFVQDRVRAADGAPLWCGALNSEEFTGFRTCMTREGSEISINANSALGSWRRTLPPDSFREFRLR